MNTSYERQHITKAQESDTEHTRVTLMLVAHIAVVLAVKWMYPNLNLFYLLVGTTISSFDAIPPMLGIRPDTYHCGGVFHSIWIPIVGAALLYPTGTMSSASFLVGGLLHLITDSTDKEGRPWLNPLSRKKYGLALFPYEFREYISCPVCIVLEISSGIFTAYYLLFIGLDLLSTFWMILVTLLFVAFTVKARRSRCPE